MRVTIHQPEHLPWLGLLSKIEAVDLWIVLDSVQYRKNYFQNRNRVSLNGVPAWITVPVHAPFGTIIKSVRIAEDPAWKRRYLGTVAQSLSRTSNYHRVSPLFDFISAVEAGSALAELNIQIIEWLMAEFGIETPWIYSSELAGVGAKGDLILSLCESVGADCYLAGPSGRDYLDIEAFAASGVQVDFHDFDLATPREQPLSAIDTLARGAGTNKLKRSDTARA